MARQPYLSHKLWLYFDENFPQEIVEKLKSTNHWRRKCKVFSAKTQRMEGRGDRYHFNYCRKKGFTIVTLDKDFMDDRKYPIDNMPGVIRIVARRNDTLGILVNLLNLLEFLTVFPFPRDFVGDSKFEVDREKSRMRGRDSKTRKIKTVIIRPGDTVIKVARKFGYAWGDD